MAKKQSARYTLELKLEALKQIGAGQGAASGRSRCSAICWASVPAAFISGSSAKQPRRWKGYTQQTGGFLFTKTNGFLQMTGFHVSFRARHPDLDLRLRWKRSTESSSDALSRE